MGIRTGVTKTRTKRPTSAPNLGARFSSAWRGVGKKQSAGCRTWTCNFLEPATFLQKWRSLTTAPSMVLWQLPRLSLYYPNNVQVKWKNMWQLGFELITSHLRWGHLTTNLQIWFWWLLAFHLCSYCFTSSEMKNTNRVHFLFLI